MSQQSDGPSNDTPVGVYNLGLEYNVEIHWFPAIIEKFGVRHLEIAVEIGEEIDDIGSFTIFMHQFEFAGEWIMIATSFDDERNRICVDADLVAHQEEIGTFPHDGEEKAVMMPVPASEAKKDLN